MMDMSTTLGLQADLAMQAGQAKPRLGHAGNQEQARKTAQEFEGMFVAQMLKPIFDGLEVNSMFGGGHGEKMFRSVMVDEYGKMIARSGGIGIADSVMNEILRMQEERGQAAMALAGGPTPNKEADQ